MSRIHWSTGVSGSFSDAGSWTGGVAPGTHDVAVLDAPGAYTVSSSTDQSVVGLETSVTATLTIKAGVFTATTGAGASLTGNLGAVTVADGAGLALGGTMTGSGKIALLGSTLGATITLLGHTLLKGGGNLSLSDSAENKVGASPAALENVDDTISGAGTLGGGGRLINDVGGKVIAFGLNGLVIDSSRQTDINLGVLQAGLAGKASAGGLTIARTTLDQALGGGSGLVLATNASHVSLETVHIVGGVLKSVGAAWIQTVDRLSTLDGLTRGVLTDEATINILGGTALTMLGEIANSGHLHVLAPPAGGFSDLIIARGSAELDGRGTISLAPGSRVYGRAGGGATPTLDNVDNIISGAGRFGLGTVRVLNDAFGVINANGGELDLVTAGSLVNAGLIEATGTGLLVLHHETIDSNTGGVVSVSGTGRLELRGSTLTGGRVSVAAGARILSAGGQVSVIDTGGVGAVSNAGTLEGTAGSLVIHSPVANSGALVALGGLLEIDGPVVGTGTARIKAGTLRLGSSFSQAVTFMPGTTGRLDLTYSQGFAATISGFSMAGLTSVDLRDIAFSRDLDTIVFAPGVSPTAGGVLSIDDSIHLARLHLVGDFTQVRFVAHDDGSGGTLITAQSTQAAAQFAAAAAAMPTHTGDLERPIERPAVTPLLAVARC